MRYYTYLSTLALSSVCLAAPAAWGPPGGGPQSGPPSGPPSEYGGTKAIYFLRVDPAGSSVVAIEMSSDGLLTNSTSVTSTQGDGLQSKNASAPGEAPVGLDPLQGQQAVSIGNDYLFTINSGSDTAVMFKINPEDPLELEMVGSPVPTLGQFAMSIAYSSKYEIACVLNGGKVNGVTCYTVDAEKGLIPDGVGLREFGFGSVTPPVLGGPKGSGSDIQFTGNSSKLIATFKGESKPATLGHTVVFSVDESGVAKKGNDNMVSPLVGNFGFALDGTNADHIFISDVTFGGALVSLDYDTNAISVLQTVNSTTFKASCWAAYAYSTDLTYLIDAGSNHIGKVNSETGDLLGFIHYDKDLVAATDTVTAGPMAYFLTATNNIGVLDLESGKLVQAYEYSTPSNRPFWTGMAKYPASPLLYGGLD